MLASVAVLVGFTVDSAQAGWTTPSTLSATGQNAEVAKVAVDSSGNAVATWRRYSGSFWVIQAATKPAGGSWSSVATLSPVNVDNADPSVAIDNNGRATVVWYRYYANSYYAVFEATKTLAGSWVSNATPISAGGNSYTPTIDTNAAGDTVVGYYQLAGSYYVHMIRRPAGSSTWGTDVTLDSANSSSPINGVAVGIDSAGTSTIVWNKYVSGSFASRIRGVTLTSAQTSGSGSDLYTANDSTGSRLAINEAGDVVIAFYYWSGARDLVGSLSKPAGGSWSAFTSLAGTSQTVSGYSVGIDSAGIATAAWNRSNGTNTITQTSTRPAGAATTWSAATDLSATGANVTSSNVAVNAAGDATVVWNRSNGTNTIIQSRSKPAGGSWGSTSDLSATGQNATFPTVGLDSSGNGTATWLRAGGPNTVVQAADQDVVAPNTTMLTTPSNPSADPNPSFTFSSDDVSATFECQIDGGGYSACTTPKSYSSLTDGSHTVDVRAKDSASNVDGSPASYTWTIDATGPTTSFLAYPDNPTGLTTAFFSFSANETSTFECKLDGASYTTCSSPQNLNSLSEGSHTYYVRATDNLLNVGTPATYTWTVDTTAPNTSILTSPSNPSNSASASFTFDSTEPGSTFECQIDNGGYSTCSTPKNYSNLSQGSHTFDVRAIDPSGNSDGSPASYTWTIDTAAPGTTILTHPTDPSGSTSAAFTFESDDLAASFQCQLDNGGYSSCATPKNYSSLAAGSHTFDVRATDAAGNTDGTPASYTWTIDTTAPTASILTQPSDPSNSTSPSFTFESNDVAATFECQLDSGGYSSCATPKNYSSVAQGSHTFYVRATDAVNNTGTPASYTWTVDTTAPTTSILAHPSDPSNSTSPSFTFESDDGAATFECQLDSGGYSSCSTPKDYSNLTAGAHTFYVRATDAAGNTDGTPASYGWTIDTTAPTASILTHPASQSNDVSPSFTFESNDVSATFECQLDSGGYSSCSTPKSYSNLAAGSHTFYVRATDTAGNTGSADSYTWTVDTTAPSASILTQPSDPSNSTSPSFTFESNDVAATFECQLDSGGYSSCATPKNYSSVAQGSHTFYVRATDTAGNTGSADSYTWTVDTTAPTASILSHPDNPSNATNPEFTFSSNDGTATFECQLDSSGYSSCTDPKNYSSLAQGSHTFYVRATDDAGNVGSADTYTWTLDTTAPTATILTHPSNPSNDTNPEFSFSSNDGTATFECKLDSGSYSSCSTPKDYSNLADGSHNFYVRATDTAGNSGAADSYTWTVDATAPTATILTHPSDPSNDTNPEFSFSSNDGTATFQCKLNSGGYATCASGDHFTVADGSNTLDIRAIDAAGNIGAPDSYAWTVDTGAPDTTINSSPTDPSSDTDPAFTFESDDLDATFECKLDSGSYSTCATPKQYTGLADGSHTFFVRAIDSADNVDSTPATQTWLIDTGAPTVEILTHPSNPSNDPSPSFAFESNDPDATFECQVDSGGYTTCTTPKSYANLADGPHTFDVKAIDGVNNESAPDSYTWNVDTTPPAPPPSPPAPTPPASGDTPNTDPPTTTPPTQRCESAAASAPRPEITHVPTGDNRATKKVLKNRSWKAGVRFLAKVDGTARLTIDAVATKRSGRRVRLGRIENMVVNRERRFGLFATGRDSELIEPGENVRLTLMLTVASTDCKDQQTVTQTIKTKTAKIVLTDTGQNLLSRPKSVVPGRIPKATRSKTLRASTADDSTQVTLSPLK